MAAEEVEQEVEAMQAVYGPDCTVFRLFPPHLSVAMKPRTADDPSVQFVEAVLVIKAGDQYPDVPPELELKNAKGLGDRRHAKLLGDLNSQSIELSGEPMLVAICEAATDLLTEMNVPEGDCCFCMNALVMDDGAQPYMKLMSCFHCFHSHCFGEWWRWLQHQQDRRMVLWGIAVYTSRFAEEAGGGSSEHRVPVGHQVASSELRVPVAPQEPPVQCPVCRMIINAEDVAHVQDYLTAKHGLDSVPETKDIMVSSVILNEAELARRAKFTAEFEAQQARGGIIEPKKLEVIQPGMIVPSRTSAHEEATLVEPGEEGQASTDGHRESFAAPYGTVSDTSTQAPGIQYGSQVGGTHLLPNPGQGGSREGRSYRGHFRGRFLRGRQGGSVSGNRGYRGRSGMEKDTGSQSSEPQRGGT